MPARPACNPGRVGARTNRDSDPRPRLLTVAFMGNLIDSSRARFGPHGFLGRREGMYRYDDVSWHSSVQNPPIHPRICSNPPTRVVKGRDIGRIDKKQRCFRTRKTESVA